MTLLDRLAAKFAISDECWEWTASKTPGGYGRIFADGRKVYAHRAVYEAVVGPIPEGFQIDHLCRNRGCVNPDHLEPVTRRENLLRGVGFVAVNAAKTHCPKGHPYDEENTYQTPTGRRVCRTCMRETDRRRR